jgi:ferredoxin--NADP+ reductase
MEFFLELVPHGKLSPMLWSLKPGEQLLLHDRPAGIFTLDRKSGAARHLMAATTTGAAPYISMVRAHRHGLATGTAADDIRLALVHGAGVSSEFGPYLDELRAASDEGWLNYIPTVSRPLDDPEWAGEVGLIEDVIRKYADMLGFNHMDAVAYAAGDPRMIENVKGILTRACFTKGQIHTEKYFSLK